jgi:hypothetical protein
MMRRLKRKIIIIRARSGVKMEWEGRNSEREARR